MTPIIIARFPSAFDGQTVAIAATIGGNTGTGRVVDLTIAPAATLDAMRAYNGPGGQRGGAYVRAIADDMASVCGGCPAQIKGFKVPCYVQRNARSAGQPAKALATSADTADGRGAWQAVLRMAQISGIAWVRSAVAGDAGAIPADVWAWIVADIADHGLSVLGYTHASRKRGQAPSAPHLRGSHMASVHSIPEAEAAIADGWGAFAALPVSVFVGGFSLPEGAELCPKSAEAKAVHGAPVTCEGCGKCDGGKRLIVVPSHGPGDASRKRSKALRGVEIRNANGAIVGRF